jgi:hypothetical protein
MASVELPRVPKIADLDYDFQVKKFLHRPTERDGCKHEHRCAKRPTGAPTAAATGAPMVAPAASATAIVDQLKQARALINAATDAIIKVRDRELGVTNDELERLYDAAWDVYDAGDQVSDLVDSFIE